jgi:hypothetical protein
VRTSTHCLERLEVGGKVKMWRVSGGWRGRLRRRRAARRRPHSSSARPPGAPTSVARAASTAARLASGSRTSSFGLRSPGRLSAHLSTHQISPRQRSTSKMGVCLRGTKRGRVEPAPAAISWCGISARSPIDPIRRRKRSRRRIGLESAEGWPADRPDRGSYRAGSGSLALRSRRSPVTQALYPMRRGTLGCSDALCCYRWPALATSVRSGRTSVRGDRGNSDHGRCGSPSRRLRGGDGCPTGSQPGDDTRPGT